LTFGNLRSYETDTEPACNFGKGKGNRYGIKTAARNEMLLTSGILPFDTCPLMGDPSSRFCVTKEARVTLVILTHQFRLHKEHQPVEAAGSRLGT